MKKDKFNTVVIGGGGRSGCEIGRDAAFVVKQLRKSPKIDT